MNSRLGVALVIAVLTAIAAAGCGGTSGQAANRGVPAGTSLHVETTAGAAMVCMPKSSRAQAGDPAPGTCVLQLPAGDRYQCPTELARKLGAVTDAARNRSCRKLPPLKIPRSWRPAVRRLASVTSCLERAGIDAVGGSLAGFQTYPDTPAGSLLISGTARPTTITFYPTQAGAAQGFARVRETAATSGGSAIRVGSVLVVWPRGVSSHRKAVERNCARQ